MSERLTEQQFKDYVERAADDITALRERLEDMRKANEGMAAERDEAIRQSQGYLKHARELLDERATLRARVAKLEEALRLIRRYAEEHDDEFVPFVVDEALAALEDAPK